VIDQAFREMPVTTLLAARYQLHHYDRYSFDPFNQLSYQIELSDHIFQRYLSSYSVPAADILALEIQPQMIDILKEPYDLFRQLCSTIEMYLPEIKYSVRLNHDRPVVGDISLLHQYCRYRNLPHKAIYYQLEKDIRQMVETEEKIIDGIDHRLHQSTGPLSDQQVSHIVNKMDRLKIIMSGQLIQHRQRHKALADHFRDHGLGPSDPSKGPGSGPRPA
jgi:hypothetical protein